MQPQLPCIEDLREYVAELKKNLQLPAEKCREIELKTRDQSLSSLWFSVRRYRITASYFGVIYRRLPTTPPHSLVLQISFSDVPICAGEWLQLFGIDATVEMASHFILHIFLGNWIYTSTQVICHSYCIQTAITATFLSSNIHNIDG